MTRVLLTIQGTLTTAINFRHYSEITNDRNIDILGRDSDSENYSARLGILTDKPFFLQNALGQPREGVQDSR